MSGRTRTTSKALSSDQVLLSSPNTYTIFMSSKNSLSACAFAAPFDNVLGEKKYNDFNRVIHRCQSCNRRFITCDL